ncbi:MAG: hypothetical protein ACI8TP_004357 [Acidimicrobiales bacterium]|jgi:hypothetical protein
MGKESRKDKNSKLISPVADQGRSWFLPVVVVIALIGVAAVAVLASQRESNVGIAPRALVDHWHGALLIHDCGTDLPFSADDNDPEGVHTHGDGLMHVHPFTSAAAGKNATLGAYLRATGGVLTDDLYVPGPGEVPTQLDEAVQCAGEDSQLVLAYWDDPDSETPEIITTDLNNFPITADNFALTLARVPVGTDPADIPKSPLVGQIEQLGSLDGG